MCATRRASPEVRDARARTRRRRARARRGGQARAGLDHPRSGELVAISQADRWFSYYYWLDDERAPDYARTVDIHRKPGYDPVELFVDPGDPLSAAAVGWRLAKRKLGQRTLLDVISLKDTQLVKGSHGRLTDDPDDGPLVISSDADLLPAGASRRRSSRRWCWTTCARDPAHRSRRLLGGGRRAGRHPKLQSVGV